MVVSGILIIFSILMWTLWIQEINCFSKMTELLNFEAVEDNVNDVIDVNEGGEM